MDDIRARALARGVVIEYGIALAKVLQPEVSEAIEYRKIFGNTGVPEINRRARRTSDPLSEDITTWSITDVSDVIYYNWRPQSGAEEFEAFFRKKYRKLNLNEFRDDLRRMRFLRDNAAHPEFVHRFDIEDAKEFLRAGERVSRKLKSPLAADLTRELEGLDDLTMRKQTVLERVYPDERSRDFERAEELWLTGTNMRRIVTDDGDRHLLGCIERVLGNGGTVKVLMIHPLSDVCKYAMMQDSCRARDLNSYRDIVGRNLQTFSRMRTKCKGGEKLQVRTIDYAITFGLDIMNGNDEPKTTVYVRFYPFPEKDVFLDDRPIIKFNRNDSRWCQFFVEQFKNHWKDEKEGGWAESLPDNYLWQSN